MISAILAALFLFAATAAVFVSEDEITDPGLGEGGTEYIYSADDLAQLARFVNTGGDTAGITYILTDDLDLSGYSPWDPIGTESKYSFKGIFEGNGFTITGLYINNTGLDHVGLFGYVVGGAIKNLTVKDADITGKNHVGGIAGQLNPGSADNCHVTGSIYGLARVGGIAGTVNNSTAGIHDSSFVGRVAGKAGGSATAFDFIGGIAGYISTSRITGCYAEASVQGRDSIGGIVGHISGSTVVSVVSDCYFIGDVTGRNYIGGIVGDMNRTNVNTNITVTKCYAVGTVYGTNSVGGIVGYLHNGKLTNCVALNESVTATGADAGRVVGTVNPSAAPATELSNNAAFADMTAGETAFAEGQNVASGRDGKDLSANSISTDGTLDGHFAEPVWIIEEGKLPSFRPYDMPLYLIPADLESWMFESIDDITYNGEEQMPEVSPSASADNVTFILIEYLDNIDAGTASVVLKGTGRYIGTLTLTFEIVPKTISAEILFADGPYVYRGTPWTPAYIVGLAEGDYTISYKDNIDAGTATVTLTGIGNYTGNIVGTFTIEGIALSDQLQIAPGPFVYDGSAFTPADVTGLEEGKDYTISYKDNIDAGTASVEITGAGNYLGTLSAEFTIVPRPITVTPTEGQGKEQGAEDPVLTYTIYNGTRGIELGGSLSRTGGEDAGTYMITIGTLGHANYDITFTEGILFEITEVPAVPDTDVSDTEFVRRTISMPVTAFAVAIVALLTMIAAGVAVRTQKK